MQTIRCGTFKMSQNCCQMFQFEMVMHGDKRSGSFWKRRFFAGIVMRFPSLSRTGRVCAYVT